MSSTAMFAFGREMLVVDSLVSAASSTFFVRSLDLHAKPQVYMARFDVELFSLRILDDLEDRDRDEWRLG